MKLPTELLLRVTNGSREARERVEGDLRKFAIRNKLPVIDEMPDKHDAGPPKVVLSRSVSVEISARRES